MQRIRSDSNCPEVRWQASYVLLGPADYLDIFTAPDNATATKGHDHSHFRPCDDENLGCDPVGERELASSSSREGHRRGGALNRAVPRSEFRLVRRLPVSNSGMSCHPPTCGA